MKRRIISFVLLVMLVFSLAACNNKKKPQYGEEVPTYVSDKEYHIGMWVGVPNAIREYDENGYAIGDGRTLTDEEFDNHYKLIKEAGFNYVDSGYGEYAPSYNIRALKAAQKYGLNQYIGDLNLSSWLMNDVQDEDVVLQKIEELSADYMQYSSFAGLRIRDEPAFHEIEGYQIAKERFDKVFGDRTFYINLLPVIASTSSITSDYKSYIKEYVKKINTPYVSYDHYPLKTDARNNNYVLENFLYNIELVKEAAPDKEVWTFLQSIGYGSSNRSIESVADATFQAYSFMAYGGEGRQWFCYWSPPGFDGATTFKEGCIARDGSTTPAYDYVKTANLEIRGLEDIYFNFDWQGVMPIIGVENDEGGENSNFSYLEYKVLRSHERIKSIRTQQDTLTGVFKDAQGRDGFMIVNFTEPSAKLDNKVEIEFNNATRAIVVKKGVQEVVDTVDGKLTFTMDEGEGYFVIPLK
ncbi:MAG: hypothetical protein IJV67_06405 [Clostridia bacterium]|nr:hypothetical protein [Clostridia bacterium]